jgi:hypothetical protein
MGCQVNQLNVYLIAAALIIGCVTGYVLGIGPRQAMLTKMDQMDIELASLKEEFIAYSGRDWHLAYNYGESFGKDSPQVIRNDLGPFYLSGNEVRFVWLFESQKHDDRVPGILEITLRYVNGTVVGRRTTSSVFTIGSADMDLRAAGNYTIGFMATGCVDTFIWVWDYG